MHWLAWVAIVYLIIAVLTFIGLCRRLEPLDLVALASVGLAALIWPITLALG
jgi:hypothetical protein